MKNFLAVGADEFGDPLREKETCPNCGNQHPTEYAKDAETGVTSKMLAFVHCENGSSYLVGINGQKLQVEQ